jgi:hypothetical protein
VDEASVERVRLIRREGTDDENRDDEAVNGDDTGHDDRYERLCARWERRVSEVNAVESRLVSTPREKKGEIKSGAISNNCSTMEDLYLVPVRHKTSKRRLRGRKRRTFMINSGLRVPIPVIPIPAFAVP